MSKKPNTERTGSARSTTAKGSTKPKISKVKNEKVEEDKPRRILIKSGFGFVKPKSKTK